MNKVLTQIGLGLSQNSSHELATLRIGPWSISVKYHTSTPSQACRPWNLCPTDYRYKVIKLLRTLCKFKCNLVSNKQPTVSCRKILALSLNSNKGYQHQFRRTGQMISTLRQAIFSPSLSVQRVKYTDSNNNRSVTTFLTKLMQPVVLNPCLISNTILHRKQLRYNFNMYRNLKIARGS